MFENRLRKAVIPLSLDEPRQKVIAMSKTLSHFGTKKITLVHVKTGSNRKSTQAREKLQIYAQKIQELGYETDIQICFGQNIIQEIYNTSIEIGAEFLCIVWRHKGMIRKTLIGSKTIDTVRLINLPIFIFKPRNPLSKDPSLETILYATDFKSTDSIVMPYLNNKEITASTLFLLHVGERAPDPQTEKLRLDSVYANLNRLKQESNDAFQDIKTIEAIGSPKRQIVRQANKFGVDMILIGKFDVKNPLEQIMGSTAEAIPFKSGCSIFIVPGY